MGLVRSMLRDSWQTLSNSISAKNDMVQLIRIMPTNVVGLVKDNDCVLGHFFRDLFGDFRVEQVVKGVDHDIDIGKLENV
jgi:hypothetical protein